ncbi:MAG TPA: hypothetical protein VJ732_14555 [Bryobacteraceae bacterium]|nr:hypothetical protein [Bryobacteraceae bacterium]
MVPAFRCTDEDIQWAGLSCSDQDPCPVYLELSAVAAAGDRIFAAGNIHSETVTLYSILLGSADAGKTWSEPYPRIRGAGLDRIQFAGPANGWIGGETLFPLPQDPFLLITSDSGTTWRRQPLFSEPHPGSIQQFWFSSPQEGSLIVDRGEGSAEERYELYESPDGGQSWTVKQLSQKPIRLKAGPATAATWRVRADGPTQSFRIERHEGERWTAEASFAVNLGVCKPVPAEPPLPPSEPLPPGPASPPAPSLRRQHP